MLAVLAQKLDLPPPATQVIKETRKVPTLEMITGVMTAQYPDQDLPKAAVCEKIGHIFLKLSEANKAYGEVAEALAEISTKVSPQHYTLLLRAATALTIQIIVPPNMTSPIVAPPLPPPQAATPLGHTAIVDAMKLKFYPTQMLSAYMSTTKIPQSGYWQLPSTRSWRENSSTAPIPG